MMKYKESHIRGVYEIENFIARDDRGIFIKTYHHDVFKQMGFKDGFKESYYSSSHKNVIRGMHFQVPPHDHEKLIYVTEGKILDVIIDLRKQSGTYGSFLTTELHAFGNGLFVPKGFAHGFLTLTENATVVYNVATVYHAASDTGIRWDSFGFDWKVSDPVMSERDRSFVGINDFVSPFH